MAGAEGSSQGAPGQGQDVIGVKGQAGGVSGSGREYEQGLHRVMGGSGASEVRDHGPGPPTPQDQRYPGQLVYKGQNQV